MKMVSIPEDAYNMMRRALEGFSMETTYTQGERTGGILKGCARGPAPTSKELAVRARIILRSVDLLLLAQSGDIAADDAADNYGFDEAETLDRPHAKPMPIRIHRQPLLVEGGIGTETLPNGQTGIIIYLADRLSCDDLAVTLWHEAVHLLMVAAGISADDHDEDAIEAAAVKLAAACPEIVDLCRL